MTTDGYMDEDYPEYKELVESANTQVTSVAEHFSELCTRARKWASIHAQEYDKFFPGLWKLEQSDIEHFYIHAFSTVWKEQALFKPDNKYEHERYFILEYVEALIDESNEYVPVLLNGQGTRYDQMKQLYTKQRMQGYYPKETTEPEQVEKLELSVAGTAFTINSDEAALIAYVPCRLRGRKVDLLYPGSQIALQAQVMGRAIQNDMLCFALFKRLRMRNAFDNVFFTNEECRGRVFTGEHSSEAVTLNCGNITEVEFIDDEEEA